MSIWRELIEVARLVPSEFELWVYRKVMAIHSPDPDLPDRAWCGSRVHRPPELWPCEEFLRVDRAVDAVLDKRASRKS